MECNVYKHKSLGQCSVSQTDVTASPWNVTHFLNARAQKL
jgi:hypothetical protein